MTNGKPLRLSLSIFAKPSMVGKVHHRSLAFWLRCISKAYLAESLERQVLPVRRHDDHLNVSGPNQIRAAAFRRPPPDRQAFAIMPLVAAAAGPAEKRSPGGGLRSCSSIVACRRTASQQSRILLTFGVQSCERIHQGIAALARAVKKARD